MDNNEKKMSLQEYEEKYSRPERTRTIKSFMFVCLACIGLIIAACLFFFCCKVYEFNEYAGYGSIALAVLLFIFLYIMPVVKINTSKAFIINVNGLSVTKAKRYNRKLREEIAEKMIDVSAKTESIGWYSDKHLADLLMARHTKNDKLLKQTLTAIYDEDVRKNAQKYIRDYSLKVGLTTALSQSDKLDTLFVVAYELDLIKQLVYLYGYRPSDSKLLKIYKTVITNSLLAYGIQNSSSNLATGLVKKMGSAMDSIPLLGSIIGTVIDSASQGIINSTMTVVIGYQTKKYLKEEYHLQDILDDIDLSDEVEALEEQRLVKEVTDEVGKKSKKNKEQTKNNAA